MWRGIWQSKSRPSSETRWYSKHSISFFLLDLSGVSSSLWVRVRVRVGGCRRGRRGRCSHWKTAVLAPFLAEHAHTGQCSISKMCKKPKTEGPEVGGQTVHTLWPVYVPFSCFLRMGPHPAEAKSRKRRVLYIHTPYSHWPPPG